MRLLAVADSAPHLPLAALVEAHRPDVVALLGDLEPDWLDQLGRFDLPVLGVYGNHDDGRYLDAANTTNLHLASVTIDGVAFAGFEGCVRYKKRGTKLQYTQAEASRLARRLPPADVLLAHAPPAGIHEEPDDRAHEGFTALRDYIDRVRPGLVLHGHTPPPPRGTSHIDGTRVVHVVGARLVVFECATTSFDL